MSDVFVDEMKRMERRLTIFKSVRLSLSELQKAREIALIPEDYDRALEAVIELYNQAGGELARAAEAVLQESQKKELPHV